MNRNIPTIWALGIVGLLGLLVAGSLLILTQRISSVSGLQNGDQGYEAPEFRKEKDDVPVRRTVLPALETREFKNTQFNFKFQYPDNYRFDEGSGGGAVYSLGIGPSYSEVFGRSHPNFRAFDLFRLYIQENPQGLDAQVKQGNELRSMNEKGSEDMGTELISGRTARIIKSCDMGQTCSKIVYLEKDKRIYFLELDGYFTAEDEVRNAFDTMLSSFVFFDPTVWDTYLPPQSQHTYKTGNWMQFSIEEDSAGGLYKLDYPGSWKIQSTVFHDPAGTKVAELSPGYVTTGESQQCFATEFESERAVLLSQESFRIGPNKGELRVVATHPEGDVSSGHIDTWFPRAYCIEGGDKAFIITFYSRTESPSAEDQRVYERIISSFRFINPEAE